MNKLLPVLLCTCQIAFACGPYFPSTYLDDGNDRFIENINLPVELVLLAQEYDLVGLHPFTDSDRTTAEVDLEEFARAAKASAHEALTVSYAAYACAARENAICGTAPDVPDELREFVLYLDGFREMQNDTELTEPLAWARLLDLDPANRMHRTTWVHYMLGNLASGHGQPEQASLHYAACRRAVLDGFIDPLGLAHASYKREQLAQTNHLERVRCGVMAVAYYQLSGDSKRLGHCFEHLKVDLGQLDMAVEDPLCREALALFRYGDPRLFTQLAENPPLKITPRLAWFMYKGGRIDHAMAYLESCPEDDILANWLRFRIAQRNGHPQEATALLRKWMDALEHDPRIYFTFRNTGNVSPQSALHGQLGRLLVSQDHLTEALQCFLDAGAYVDSALIAERYLGTDELKRIVDSFGLPDGYALEPGYQAFQTENERGYIERRLAYLLARRLFREARPADARSYYPAGLADILDTYLVALQQSGKIWLDRNLRSAHRFHAARIMRWNGMELAGTELHPDYALFEGSFAHAGISSETLRVGDGIPPTYAETAPQPNVRYHYRYLAVGLGAEAAQLAWNRHQRAAILWTTGSWIKDRDPVAADTCYKQLARIRFQPLARKADELRWFPKGNRELDQILHSEEYIPPKSLARAADRYK